VSTLEKLADIRDVATIYAILFRNAGVGVQFFEQNRVNATPVFGPARSTKEGFREGWGIGA